MPKINAVKDGKTRSFSEIAWNLLGANHEGWVQVPDEANSKGNKVKESTDSEEVTNNTNNPIGDAEKTSKDFTVDNAIKKLKTLTTAEEVDAFMVGETRVSLEGLGDKHKATFAPVKEEEKTEEEETASED